MKNKSPFSRFEMMAQRLVEGTFNRLFQGMVGRLSLAAGLARTVEAHVQGDAVADVFQIRLHPVDFDRLRGEHPDIADQLADYITALAEKGSFVLSQAPQVRLVADPSLRRGETTYFAHHTAENKGDTTKLRPQRGRKQSLAAALRQVDAYLIISGHRHVPLDKPLISIGRRTDNDIVLEASTVSRQHAQIRWRYGRFVLYDTSNRGNTRVNGEVVSEYVLQPGDVITLSTIMLVYGEGREKQSAPRPEETDVQTQLLPRVKRSGER